MPKTKKRECRFKGKPKIDRYLRPDEYKLLLDASSGDGEANLFFEVMGKSGMRTIEAERLTVGKVDASRGGIWVWTAKRKDHPERFVALDSKIMARLVTHVEGVPGPKVFGWKEKALTRRRMRYMFKKYARRAGIRPALSVHSLRHFHGTACADAGMSMQEVAARLGHKTLEMVMEYFTLREERNRMWAEKLGELYAEEGA